MIQKYFKVCKCNCFLIFKTKQEYFKFIKKKLSFLYFLFKSDCNIINFSFKLQQKKTKLSLLKSPHVYKKAFSQYQNIEYYCI